MRKIIIIIFFYSIYFVSLTADNPNKNISRTRSFFFPNASLSGGIQYGISGARVSFKYYLGSLNLAGRYSVYGIFNIGTRPFVKGATLSHKEFALTFNKVVYSPYSNIHCSLGSGLLYRMRKVRDERISYENWTSENVYDFGVPLELNLENFINPAPMVINFGYKANLFKNIVFHTLFFDLGIWF